MDDLLILYTTWPDAETARSCAQAAVEARLAACANILSPIQSIYRWEGEMQSETETPMLLKTTRGAAERLRTLILDRHPYQTPCILALATDLAGCNLEYVTWANGQVV